MASAVKLSVAFFIVMLSAIILSVVMLSVVSPFGLGLNWAKVFVISSLSKIIIGVNFRPKAITDVNVKVCLR